MITATYAYAGVGYSAGNIDAMVDYLVAHPSEKHHFQLATQQMINGFMSGGDYRAAPKAFGVMCHVLAAVRRLEGEYILD